MKNSYEPGLVSVVLVNHNGLNDLPSCFESLVAQDYKAIEVIFVDSGSTDDSVRFVKEEFPHVTVVCAENIGYGAGNNVGIGMSRGEYIVVSNTDVELRPDCIRLLVATAKKDLKNGIVAPKILLFDDRDRINGCGDLLNFVGFATCRGRGLPADTCNDEEYLACPSGAFFLVKRNVVEQVGLLDLGVKVHDDRQGRTTQYYYQAADLAWRTLMAGYHVILQPSAIVYHKYIVKPLSADRFKDLEIARLYFVFVNYSLGTLFILFPSLVFGELVSLGFAILRGKDFLCQKIFSYYFLAKNWGFVMRKRNLNQSYRQIPDRRLIRLLSANVEFTHQTGTGRGNLFIQYVLNSVFSLLYSVSYAIISVFHL